MATRAVVALVPLKSIVILASGEPMWQWSMVGTNLPRGVLLGEPPVQSNLKGCWVDGFTHGHPGPLTFTQQSVTPWAIAH